MPTPFDLSGPAAGPAAGGPPRQLVVLLHGYGADGRDLIEFAGPLARALPHAAFLAPDAPFPCEMSPFGRQWFSLADRTPAAMAAGIGAAAPLLDGFLDRALADRGLTDADLALVGFSQGTMMALHVAARRERPCAGVVGYSGALVAPDRLAAEARARPPVLLVHGDADPVVPFGAMAAAAEALRAAGFEVEAHRRPGLGHGVDGEGLALGVRFLSRVLPSVGA